MVGRHDLQIGIEWTILMRVAQEGSVEHDGSSFPVLGAVSRKACSPGTPSSWLAGALTSCISEPRLFEDWRAEVRQANEQFHPAAFLMSHDEMRVMNQCALCQSKKMTPGELLAWNVHEAAQIIREIRPDAEIWVWNGMFAPRCACPSGPS